MTSLPSPPSSRSLPPAPFSVSSPTRPLMVSSPVVPTSESSPGVPLITMEALLVYLDQDEVGGGELGRVDVDELREVLALDRADDGVARGRIAAIALRDDEIREGQPAVQADAVGAIDVVAHVVRPADERAAAAALEHERIAARAAGQDVRARL